MKTALCIGINDYPGTSMDLAGCVNDANDWSKLLASQGFANTVLLDRQATGDGIRDAIHKHIAAAIRGDTVVIQYYGHGTWVEDVHGDELDHRDEAICPWDIMSKGPLLDDELAELVGEREAGIRVILILDSCFSGTASRMAPPNPGGRLVRYMPPAVYRTDLKSQPDRLVSAPVKAIRYASLLVAGCQEFEYSYDAWFGGRANGAFTRVAIDKFVAGQTYKQWILGIRTRLPSYDYPQRPRLYGTVRRKHWLALV